MADNEVLIVYDKQCPACDYYCNLLLKLLGKTRINNLGVAGNDKF
jgi:predicted DCC family thiol-disulfide oxidoreductase YuxK